MNKMRMEAFSDGVIAILITVMIFDIKPPADTSIESLRSLAEAVLTYLMSFLYLGIYWNNHHHLLLTVRRVNGSVMWANLHLLFWLSLLPFATNWMRSSRFTELPTATYGFVLLCAAIAYKLLQRTLIRAEGDQSKLKVAIGSDGKGKFSVAAYAFALVIARWMPLVSLTIYVAMACIWLLPDRRIERIVDSE